MADLAAKCMVADGLHAAPPRFGGVGHAVLLRKSGEHRSSSQAPVSLGNLRINLSKRLLELIVC